MNQYRVPRILFTVVNRRIEFGHVCEVGPRAGARCQRTLHAMPLSFTILAKVGQLCWKTDYVWDWFMEGVKADLFNREGTTPLGAPRGPRGRDDGEPGIRR